MVGERKKIDGRLYEKSANGNWSPVWEGRLLASLKSLYVDQGLALREVAKQLSLPGHKPISHSVVQQQCNKHGLMRSHYGATEITTRNARKIAKALMSGVPVVDAADYIGVNRNLLVRVLDDLDDHDWLVKPVAKPLRLSQRGSAYWNELLMLDPVELRTYQAYARQARRLTNLVVAVHHIDGVAERGMWRHLDHVFSLRDGFKHRLPLGLVCHPSNLRIVHAGVNTRKGDRSDISLRSLRAAAKRNPLRPINHTKEVQRIMRELNIEVRNG